MSHVACLVGKFIHPTSTVVWYFFWVFGFDALLYCVCASKIDVNVCMFKETGNLYDFWAAVHKCCPLFCSHLLLFLCELCVARLRTKIQNKDHIRTIKSQKAYQTLSLNSVIPEVFYIN